MAGGADRGFHQPGQSAYSISLLLALASVILILLIESHFWASIFVMSVLGASPLMNFFRKTIMRKSRTYSMPEWYPKIMLPLYLVVVAIMLIFITS